MDKLDFQNEIVERFNISCANRKLFHSYIFSGGKNSGQLEVAKHVAKLLIANNDFEEEAQIDELAHPNLFYITTDKQNISKEQVISMTAEINTTSLTGNNKVFIVQDAHKLSVSAQNSLLKVIEEPEGNSYVIFIVENVYQLLTTIVSRSQIVKFKPLPFTQRFQEVSDEYDDLLKLKYAIYLSDTEYDSLYYDDLFENYLTVVNKYLNNYFKNDSVYMLEEIMYKHFKNKDEYTNILNLLIINVSSMISYKERVEHELFDERLMELTNNCNITELSKLLNKLFECYEMVQSNVNARLAFDKISRRE